jgi:hypothetical protein
MSAGQRAQGTRSSDIPYSRRVDCSQPREVLKLSLIWGKGDEDKELHRTVPISRPRYFSAWVTMYAVIAVMMSAVLVVISLVLIEIALKASGG